jgi:hypothetical protein
MSSNTLKAGASRDDSLLAAESGAIKTSLPLGHSLRLDTRGEKPSTFSMGESPGTNGNGVHLFAAPTYTVIVTVFAKLKAFLPKMASSLNDTKSSSDPVSIENIFTEGGDEGDKEGIEASIDSGEAVLAETEEGGSEHVQMVRGPCHFCDV